MATVRLALIVVAAGMLGACATPPAVEGLGAGSDLAARAEVVGVPFHPQEENFCGPAALASVLVWSGGATTQAAMARAVYTPGRAGTLQSDLVAAARRQGRLAVPVRDLAGLLGELAAGHPVLVLQNLGLDWVPQWHYAVAVGYDLTRAEIVLRSGREARRRTSLATFERTWARADHWALVVLPPAELPARADEAAILAAAIALERTGRIEDAAVAYETILARWPTNYGGAMGLANARYALGDLAAAKDVLRRTVRDHPDEAGAWNNLAQVLAEQGERGEALAAAARALELGGDDIAIYRTTYRQIAADA